VSAEYMGRIWPLLIDSQDPAYIANIIKDRISRQNGQLCGAILLGEM